MTLPTPIDPAGRTLADLFVRLGEPVPERDGGPIALIEPGTAWCVVRGACEVVAFTFTRDRGNAEHDRRHLLDVGPGGLIVGFEPPHGGSSPLILATPSADSEVRRMPLARLSQHATDPSLREAIAGGIDAWITGMGQVVAQGTLSVLARTLRPGESCAVEPRSNVQPASGVLWFTQLWGSSRLLGEDLWPPIAVGRPFPLSSDVWLSAAEPSGISAARTVEQLAVEDAWRGLEHFNAAILGMLDLQGKRARAAAVERLRELNRRRRSDREQALGDLRDVIDEAPAPVARTASGLAGAVRQAASVLGVRVREPHGGLRADSAIAGAARMIEGADLRLRPVRLAPGWHHAASAASPPMVAFIGPEARPVAITPTARGFVVHSGIDAARIDDDMAATIGPVALELHRTLPARATSPAALVGIALRGMGPTVAWSLAGCVALGLALATPPLVLARVIDAGPPFVEGSAARGATAALLAVGLAAGLLGIARAWAAARVGSVVASRVSGCLLDRALHLPAWALSRLGGPELASRILRVELACEAWASSVASLATSATAALASVATLAWAGWSLGAPAWAWALGVLGVVGLAGLWGMVAGAWARTEPAVARTADALRARAATLLEMLPTLRVAAAEDRAFAQWAGAYAQHARARRRALAASARAGAIDALAPALGTIAAAVALASISTDRPSMAGAIGMIALSATTLAWYTGISLADARRVAMLARIRTQIADVLSEAPESGGDRADPGPLRGRIELEAVTFRYRADDPPILQNVSLDAQPGQLIAIVGASGSGKSTLARVLLGFERPEAGAILFDGYDAAGLDMSAVRGQMGIVLQDDGLMPGDILSNIASGDPTLGEEAALEAAMLAGLGPDLEAMPMGLRTIITEGGSGLSAGQAQRVLLARALARKPRMILLDEATSALDQPAQDQIMTAIGRLNITRVVIAHRLATIRHADRVYVLERGRVVQAGTPAELLDRPGRFRDLYRTEESPAS